MRRNIRCSTSRRCSSWGSGSEAGADALVYSVGLRRPTREGARFDDPRKAGTGAIGGRESAFRGEPGRTRHALRGSTSRGTPHGAGPVRDHPRLLGLARARRDRLRPGPRRPLRDPRRRQHRRALAGRQRRVRRLAVRSSAWSWCSATRIAAPSSATVDELERPPDAAVAQPALDRRPMRPAVEPLMDTELRTTRRAGQARRARQRPRSVDHLRHGSRLLENLIQKTASWSSARSTRSQTGQVDFFDPHEGS